MVQRQLTRRIYLTETNESTTLEHNECANDDSARIESTLSFLCDETSPLSTPLKWVVWGPLILLRGGEEGYVIWGKYVAEGCRGEEREGSE